MGNHVIRDRIWASRKLAACSREAALAYPWLYLVADPWGRFEYSPRRIWTLVFGGRTDVLLADVEAWLAEYERHGLLLRYHIDGDLAVWTGFRDRPKGKRRPSDYPDPGQFTKCGSTSAAKVLPEESGSTSAPMELVRDLDRDRELEGEVEKTARARRKSLPSPVSVEQTTEREAIDAYNAVFGTEIDYTPGNLRAAARAFAFGYTLTQMRRVFQAVKARETDSANWCFLHKREFEYLVRPEHKSYRTQEITPGRIDVILNELATGAKAV